jgi:hypothetical protein
MGDADVSVLPPPGGDVYALLRQSHSADVYEPLCFSASSRSLVELAEKGEYGVYPFTAGADNPEAVIIRGRFAPGERLFDFGVNRFFIPEGAPEPPRESAKVALLLVAEDMTPRLRGLEVDGKPWEPEERKAEEER